VARGGRRALRSPATGSDETFMAANLFGRVTDAGQFPFSARWSIRILEAYPLGSAGLTQAAA
jgi:hypothetical protein